MVDEQRLADFAHGQVGRLPGLESEPLEMLVTERDKHAAPIALAREAPDRRAENVVLSSVGISQEAAASEGIGEAKDAASVDSEQVGELAERDRASGLGYCLQTKQAAIQALNRRRFQCGSFHLQ